MRFFFSMNHEYHGIEQNNLLHILDLKFFYIEGGLQFIQWTAQKQIPAGIGLSTLRTDKHKN